MQKTESVSRVEIQSDIVCSFCDNAPWESHKSTFLPCYVKIAVQTGLSSLEESQQWTEKSIYTNIYIYIYIGLEHIWFMVWIYRWGWNCWYIYTEGVEKRRRHKDRRHKDRRQWGEKERNWDKYPSYRLSIYLPKSLLIYLSVYLSQSFHPNISFYRIQFLSIYLSLFISIYLSIYLFHIYIYIYIYIYIQ